MTDLDDQFDQAQPTADSSTRTPSRRPAPVTHTADEICKMQFDPVRFVVPGYIPEGCTLLAGPPKLGKSWLCLDFALAVASGRSCLGGAACKEGDVLYLALEDNRRRLKDRLLKLGHEGNALARLHISTEWPRANDGGVQYIKKWIAEHPDARLIIIDVLAMFRPTGKDRSDQPYEADYSAIKGLQQLALEKEGIAIVVVHHTRKGVGDLDPFEAISGTLGLSGAADTGLLLRRDPKGVTLYGRGRDIEEFEIAVTFDRSTCRWIAMGPASEVRRTDERTAIIDILSSSDEPMSPSEVAAALGQPANNIRQLMFKMAKDGEIEKVERGRYVVAGIILSPMLYPDNFDNRDNHGS